MWINKIFGKTARITLLTCTVFGILGCSKNDQVVGTWRCYGGATYIFTEKTWSRLNTPSSDLPYWIKDGYIFMTTLANETVPMLKLKKGVVFTNNDDVGLSGEACTRL